MIKRTRKSKVIKISVGWLIIAGIIFGMTISFFRDRVFAGTKSSQSIVIYEANQKSIDVVDIMTENTDSNNKIVNEEREIAFSVEIRENPDMPKDEEQIIQEGKNGKMRVTVLQKYKDDKLITEEIIDKTTLEEAVTEIKYVGTSEELKLQKENQIRINELKSKVDIEMDMSVPSGLTEDDFKKILSGNESDKNKIFESNASYFYEAEQKYKINGVLLAAIGIHESAWGTSKIATDKKNLFGYTAYDSNPYSTATEFNSYESAINTVARDLATAYLFESGTTISDGLIATGTYFNGKTVKSINVRYASDENWNVKVFSYIKYLYDRL